MMQYDDNCALFEHTDFLQCRRYDCLNLRLVLNGRANLGSNEALKEANIRLTWQAFLESPIQNLKAGAESSGLKYNNVYLYH